MEPIKFLTHAAEHFQFSIRPTRYSHKKLLLLVVL